jgi:hypothetical protein
VLSVVLLHSRTMPEHCSTVSITDLTGAIENRFALVQRIQAFWHVKQFRSACIYRRFEGQVFSPLKVKLKQFVYKPIGFLEFDAPIFRDSRHMKLLRLSALRTGRLSVGC